MQIDEKILDSWEQESQNKDKDSAKNEKHTEAGVGYVNMKSVAEKSKEPISNCEDGCMKRKDLLKQIFHKQNCNLQRRATTIPIINLGY